MRRLLLISLLLPLLVFAQSDDAVVAQSTDSESKPAGNVEVPATDKQAEAAKQAKSKQKDRKPKPKSQVFKPSEEISEDSPVPFPVDI